jgi:hypothetical protein
MKRLIFGAVSILLMSAAIAPSVTAQMEPENNAQPYSITVPETHQISAFNLVSQAFRGQLSAQGIPSYVTFLSAYRTGQIDAEDVVQAAVASGWLSPQILNDQSYQSAVAAQLSSLNKAYN